MDGFIYLFFLAQLLCLELLVQCQKKVRVDIVVSDLGENFYSFTIKYDIIYGIRLNGLSHTEHIPFHSHFVKYLYHEKVLEFFYCFLLHLLL